MQKILIPLDGSPLAEEAIGYALRLAGPERCELILLSIAELEEVLIAPTTIFETYRLGLTANNKLEKVENYLDQMAYEIEMKGFRVTPIAEPIKEGVAAQILKTADELDVDLIVMTTHGFTGFRQILMGSIAKEVIGKSERTVVVVKTPPKAPVINFSELPTVADVSISN